MIDYPVQLNLHNKSVVIVGGGKIAERKLLKLLETGAKITVISPTITNTIKANVAQEIVKWKQKEFFSEDIDDAFLIIAATNSPKINLQVLESCNDQQLINLVDNPVQSNFIVPATITRGKLSISVSTSGASPGLAKKIICEIANQYDSSYESYIDFLAQCRTEVQQKVAEGEMRSKILKELLNHCYYDLTKKGLYEERQRKFQRLFKKYDC
ncbi:hypothetical protein BKP37_17195 [Anaerobacillus alkalilacustris]|uniref:precorrin-2 dehydrogenase n=1 Tax=Anaerobacillus alkalilacustris TaxID=393763 RepID=A0A1S2LGG2_9BACI|nr:NAD(P)-binding protein [Anaerobacillus alkalilacustris]OIJ10797.1 hypothetical protein BKP37_17195 [Anaerobacillus alkalilacustris]